MYQEPVSGVTAVDVTLASLLECSHSRMASVLHVSLFTDHPRIETIQGAQGILGTQNTDVDCPLPECHATEASGSKHLTPWIGIPLFWHLATWIVFLGQQLALSKVYLHPGIYHSGALQIKVGKAQALYPHIMQCLFFRGG